LSVLSEKLCIEKWKCGKNLSFETISKNLSSKNSGQRLDILILGIDVFSNICSNKSLNLDSLGFLVLLDHHAARLIPVKTISFHHDSSNCFISLIISSAVLDLLAHLFLIVRQKVQFVSHQFCITINFLVYSCTSSSSHTILKS